mgnify:CR=1 FL=1
MKTVEEYYDVVVVGAGHAGCEAALAAARLGCETIIFTVSMNSVALMPCNPNIGGSSKGHLVKEIDALGGEMGKNIDKTYIQSKMLNKSKGPAVHSLRAQADKDAYSMTMRYTLQNTDHLTLRQAEVTELIVEDGVIKGVKTFSGAIYHAKTVVLATGTYLKARCLYGEVVNYTGPNGLQAANYLSQSLKDNGVELYRFKTGTPARIDKRSVNFDVMEEQFGDEKIVPFSFTNKEEDIKREQISCWLTYTNEETHKIIRDNLDRSPIYAGVIEGTGPRYCPSIEDKVVRFADRKRHQLFIEPEGEFTNEMYVGGMSSSLPEDVQYAMYRTVKGLENVKIIRNAYAIEYDCINPNQLKLSLEFRNIQGLFSGGQFNGSSGYEEAACQGLIAGINAARKCLGKDPVILDRSQAYIGVLIDDLVTKGVDEPYRMFTSRAEYRILLRMDDADMRLTERAYKLGLVKEDRYALLKSKREAVENIVNFTRNYSIKAALINDALENLGTTPLRQGCKLIDLINRPQITIENISEYVPAFKRELDKITDERKEEILEAAEILIKYEGYIGRERIIADKLARLESIKIKGKFDYDSLQSLSTEARQKLKKIDPETIAQASRIPGVSPSDINVLLVLSGR